MCECYKAWLPSKRQIQNGGRNEFNELVVLLEKNKDVMQTLDVYKKEEGKIWQRKPSPSPEEG